MNSDFTKAELFEELDRMRQGVQSSRQYEAIRYCRLIAVRVLAHRSMNEVIGEEFINGLRVDPPSVENEPNF
ncbi:MAG: hypothetical protein QNJ09_18455 [Paracoccaceae bacterium]|nr:hypothetical protein [Paracoccaceae bacterium]